MSVTVANSRFITSSLQKSVGFYQQILKGALNFQELGGRLLKEAEASFYLRQVDSLKEFGLLLSNLPIKEYRLIGQYYLGWCEYYNGSNETRIFEHVLENSTAYRPKALMSLAAIEARKGNPALEVYYFTEAIKYATSITTVLKATKGIAVVKAREGFHPSALKDLESVLPLIKYAEPIPCFDFLNSYSVELGEIGRTLEAQNVSNIVLASPCIFAYPEWRETGAEIALRGYKSRSSVPVIQSFLEPKKAKNVLRLPERERPESTRRSPFFQPSDVTSLEDWKNKMVKEPNGDNGDEKKLDEMNDKDLFMELMRVASDDSITSRKLRKMVDAIKKIASEKD
jgi:uncharacterized membrane protein (UPF0136 family)